MEKEQSGFLKFIKFIFDENNHGVKKHIPNYFSEPDLLKDPHYVIEEKRIMRGDYD